MKPSFLLVILNLILSSLNAFSCICSPPMGIDKRQNSEYNNSQLVFIGEVISIDLKNYKYKIVIKEVFKGSIKRNDTLIGLNHRYCSPTINTNGNWIFYGQINSENFIANECGLTRSFKFPENNPETLKPSPPPPNFNSKNKTELKQTDYNERDFKLKQKQKAYIDLKREIEKLRLKTIQNKDR